MKNIKIGTNLLCIDPTSTLTKGHVYKVIKFSNTWWDRDIQIVNDNGNQILVGSGRFEVTNKKTTREKAREWASCLSEFIDTSTYRAIHVSKFKEMIEYFNSI